MAGPIDSRLLLSVGGGVVVLALAVGAAVFVVRKDHGPKAPPPAATGGLVVQMGRSDDAKLDPSKPLRCFVNGQFEGNETLADCAKKNGVATEALDVGVDQTGALAAANQAGAALTPLPPSSEVVDGAATAQAAAPTGPVGECWRYSANTWRKAGDAMALNACVQMLFAGQTVRLVPHRVEISSDNKIFRSVVEQPDGACAIPEF